MTAQCCLTGRQLQDFRSSSVSILKMRSWTLARKFTYFKTKRSEMFHFVGEGTSVHIQKNLFYRL